MGLGERDAGGGPVHGYWALTLGHASPGSS